MPESLLIGPVTALVANTIYAMPARACKGYVNNSILQGNLVNSSTGMATIATTAGEFTTAAPFVWTTASSVTIRLVAL